MKEAAMIPHNGEIMLREIALHDLLEVTKVHLASFPQSALTRLGAGAVHRYYVWQLTGPHECVAIGAWRGGELCGFSFGGKFNGALGGFLEKYKWYLLGRLVTRPWLVVHPWFRDRMQTALHSLLRGFGRRDSRAASGISPIGARHAFGILAIAVAPTAKRGGVGSLLMHQSEQSARRRGAQRMHLTVAVDNREAIAFYERLGWERELQVGGWKGGMAKQLSPPPAIGDLRPSGRA